MEDSWYEGYVKSFDDLSGNHLIQYGDAEEEVLDLNKEKIDWVEEEVKSFKRLKRDSGSEKSFLKEGEESKEVRKSHRLNRNLVSEKLVFDNDDDDEGEREDDSADDDWGKNSMKGTANEEDSEEIDLVDEDEEEVKDVGTSERTLGKKSTESKKKKKDDRLELDSGKKNKTSGNQEKTIHQNIGGRSNEPVINRRGQSPDVGNNILTTDVAEQFGMHEKFCFLGVGNGGSSSQSIWTRF